MLLSDAERRHLEMMAATIMAGLGDDGHAADLATRAVNRALLIRERIRTAFTLEKEPTP